MKKLIFLLIILLALSVCLYLTADIFKGDKINDFLRATLLGSLTDSTTENKKLINYYSFEDGAKDSTGNNNGTIYGNPQLSYGFSGMGLRLDGVDDYIDAGITPENENSGTIAMWIKPESLGGLFSRSMGKNWVDERLVLHFYSTGGRADLTLSNGTSYWRNLSNSAINAGKWTYLAVSWNGSTINFYINGRIDASHQQRVAPEISGVKTWIGRVEGLYPDYFKGIVDEVKIWNYNLSQAEVLDEFDRYTNNRNPDKVVTCNNNGLCENIENQLNCPNDCPSMVVSKEIKDKINVIWSGNDRKNYFVNYINDSFASENSYVLYNVQLITNNLLDYADISKDYKLIDELSQVYLAPYEFLKLKANYTYFYLSGYPRQSVHPLKISAKMWLDKNGTESILVSSQYLYLLSHTINVISGISSQNRTQNMNDLVSKYAPVILNDHYYRWIYDDNKIFQLTGWGCNSGNYNHYNYLTKLLRKEMGKQHGYCNSVSDSDAWIISGVVEILAANKKDPVNVPINNKLKDKLVSYASLGVDLLESRTSTSPIADFKGNSVAGFYFDSGVFDDYPDYKYSGYYGVNYPKESDKKSGTNVGWDISHGRRFINVLMSLNNNRDITGKNFPDDTVLKGFANQLTYKMFNGDFAKPLFSNFIDGTNGWYRAGYSGRTGFGYGPSDLSDSVITGGYGSFSKYNPDISKIMLSFYNLINSKFDGDVSSESFFNNYYKGNYYYNFSRQYLPNYYTNLNYNILLMFLPSLSANVSGTVACNKNSDCGADGYTGSAYCSSSGSKSFVRLELTIFSTPVNAKWNIQYSDNGTNWITAYTGAGGNPVNPGTYAYTWPSAGSHRYWRLYKTNSGGRGGYHSEVQFMEEKSNLYSSSSWTQKGLVSFNASKVNDGITNVYAFHTDNSVAGSYLKLDAGLGNAKKFNKVNITFFSTPVNAKWNIQYSDNGTNWITAYTGAGGNPVNPGTYAYTWPSAGSHRYWRLYKTNSGGRGGYHSEVQFMEEKSDLYSSSSWTQKGLVSFNASKVNDGITNVYAFHTDNSVAGSYLKLDAGSQGSVSQNFTTHICENPGTTISKCTVKTATELKQQCGLNQVCSNGECK